MDSAGEYQSPTTQLHIGDDRRSDDDHTDGAGAYPIIPDATNSTTPLGSPGNSPTNTPMQSSASCSPAFATTASGPDFDIANSKRAFHTFILHTTNIAGQWKAHIAKSSRVGPAFLIFDHGDHFHIVYSSLSGGGNPIRTRDRITRFLNANDAGLTEAVITNTRIRDLRRFLYYCLRKGVSNAHCIGNTGKTELRAIYDLFYKLLAKEDPEKIIKDAKCEAYYESRKEQTAQRTGTTKAKHLADILIRQIDQYQIMSAQQWENRVPPDIKLQLIREYGLSVDSYIQRLIRITKMKKVLEVKKRTITELLLEDIYTSFPTIDETFLNNVAWIQNLFNINGIDIIEFMAWNEAIKTKRFMKINCLCLQGCTNAGKSLIDSLVRVCLPEKIPRERDNSGFHLNQLPAAASALFEEPLITPVTVGTWKLLLEGKIVKTDTKHKDKEGITRLPIWITTASPITSHIDSNGALQVHQRVKTFIFKYSIRHPSDSMPGAPNINVRIYEKAPGYITTDHFTYIWFQNFNKILETLDHLDQQNVLNEDRIRLPNNLLQQTQRLKDLEGRDREQTGITRRRTM
jgi:hypothetical protein